MRIIFISTTSRGLGYVSLEISLIQLSDLPVFYIHQIRNCIAIIKESTFQCRQTASAYAARQHLTKQKKQIKPSHRACKKDSERVAIQEGCQEISVESRKVDKELRPKEVGSEFRVQPKN